jgi:S-adenosylmethionine:tRNA ribosyltransferase-isomerase
MRIMKITVPPELAAVEPPEARGLARDEVKLLVARDRRPLRHATFTELADVLDPGDLVVVNTSDTEPAAVDGHRADGRAVVLHVSGPADGGAYVVELRTPGGQRVLDATAGEHVRLPHGVTATLVAPRTPGESRLWLARIAVEGGLHGYLACVGRPIQYSYVRGRWPLGYYRTIFALPIEGFGSAEMPSAARPFTARVLDALRARGVGAAEVVLHTGVSSLEAGEVPLPERYRVPAATADAVNATRAAGRRVVAVGTTVTRALETVADAAGLVHAGEGWTDLVLGPDRPARVVDGLVTGWHEPEASHLLLLEAVAGRRLVRRAYAAAVERGYLWHEFGDVCVLLPDRRSARRRG